MATYGGQFTLTKESISRDNFVKKQLLLRAICHRVKGNLSQTGLSFEGDLSH